MILTINQKVAKFRTVKHKASINAILISQQSGSTIISICQPTQKEPLQNAFCKTYCSSAQDSGTKVVKYYDICKKMRRFCPNKEVHNTIIYTESYSKVF